MPTSKLQSGALIYKPFILHRKSDITTTTTTVCETGSFLELQKRSFKVPREALKGTRCKNLYRRRRRWRHGRRERGRIGGKTWQIRKGFCRSIVGTKEERFCCTVLPPVPKPCCWVVVDSRAVTAAACHAAPAGPTISVGKLEISVPCVRGHVESIAIALYSCIKRIV